MASPSKARKHGAKSTPASSSKNAAASKTAASSQSTFRNRSESTTLSDSFTPSPPISTAATTPGDRQQRRSQDNNQNSPSKQQQTLREQLAVAVNAPKQRKRKRAMIHDGDEHAEDEEASKKFRQLDRLTRWSAFLYFTNNLWETVALEYYGSGFDLDSTPGQEAHAKIFDSIKGYKSKVLKHMEIHVKEFLADPEHSRLKLYTTCDLLADFFNKVFTEKSFLYVWYYMEGYVGFEGSSELGQYYIRSIYTNLAVKTKLYVDALNTERRGSARADLLRFYDTLATHPNFENVDKHDFKELTMRYRNDRHKVKQRDTEILDRCFVSLGAPPKKTTPLENGQRDADADADADGESEGG